MSRKEIGIVDLIDIVRQRAVFIVVLAVLAGAGSFLWLWLGSSPSYVAESTVVLVPAAGSGGTPRVALYRAVARGADTLRITAERLSSQGALPPDTALVYGADANVVEEQETGGGVRDLTFTFVVRQSDPDLAARIVNTWVEVFLEQSRAAALGATGDVADAFAGTLPEIRKQIEETERARNSKLDEFDTQRWDLVTEWDQRIADGKRDAEAALAATYVQAQDLMQEALASTPIDSARLHATLRQLASVRAELVRTPKVVSLEGSPSEELLAQILVDRTGDDLTDTVFTSEQIDPLNAQLTATAFDLESEVRELAQADSEGVSGLLLELQRIQAQQSAAFNAQLTDATLTLRKLRTQKQAALSSLNREQGVELGEMNRRLQVLQNLRRDVADADNNATLAGLLREREVTFVSSPAVPPSVPQQRNVVLKIVAAMFLGAMLGLTIALIRHVS